MATTISSSLFEGRPTTHVPGVGRVPSGPRSSFQYSNQSRDPGVDEMFPPRQSELGAAEAARYQTLPKEEEVDRDLSLIPAASLKEEPDSTDIQGSRESEVLGWDDTDGAYRNWQVNFQRQFMRHARSTRSDPYGSHRQNTSDGYTRSSQRSASSRDRHRSRSPRRSNISTSYRNRPSSPISFSEQRTRVRPGPDHSRSPTPSDIRERDPRCRCPIGYQCPVRSVNHLDCRPLVIEYRTLRERQDQEAFDR